MGWVFSITLQSLYTWAIGLGAPQYHNEELNPGHQLWSPSLISDSVPRFAQGVLFTVFKESNGANWKSDVSKMNTEQVSRLSGYHRVEFHRGFPQFPQVHANHHLLRHSFPIHHSQPSFQSMQTILIRVIKNPSSKSFQDWEDEVYSLLGCSAV
jgi:hypothetical protein